MTSSRLGWLALLLGLLVLALAALALLGPDLLHAGPLSSADELQRVVEARLSAPATGVSPSARSPEDFERLLGLPPDDRALDALPFYEEDERADFARARAGWAQGGPDAPVARLAAPRIGTPYYEGGAVILNWEHELETRRLATELPRQHVLALRLYRSVAGEPVELLATLPLQTELFRDADMPLVGTELSYELWSVLLAGSEGALVSAAPSDPVTLQVPDHFTMQLLGGDAERATIRVSLGRRGPPVASETVELAIGDLLDVAGRRTGLRLISLETRSEERMQRQERLVFAGDGSLVLDPLSGKPRRSGAAVLVPVERLVATLRDRIGSLRTLETDLP